jgi:SAM-dependent methyltransferase
MTAVRSHLDELLAECARREPMAWKAIERNRDRNPVLFDQLGEQLSGWAVQTMGPTWASTLCSGYRFFNSHASRHQSKYEATGKYQHTNFAEVYEATYSQSSFMNDYHWGIYAATFFWEHHLRLFEFFRDHFVSRLDPAGGQLLDLGSGSGVWSLLLLAGQPAWTSTGVDISQTSVDLANHMARAVGADRRVGFVHGDALTFTHTQQADAVVSCFVAEHLEDPQRLFNNMAANLRTRGLGFLIAALTAAEVDHICEFRRESEPIAMAEGAGLRVVATYSSSPVDYPDDRRFLPRSMGLVLQKRGNDIW